MCRIPIVADDAHRNNHRIAIVSDSRRFTRDAQVAASFGGFALYGQVAGLIALRWVDRVQLSCRSSRPARTSRHPQPARVLLVCGFDPIPDGADFGFSVSLCRRAWLDTSAVLSTVTISATPPDPGCGSAWFACRG
jgi:hypothetical protein